MTCKFLSLSDTIAQAVIDFICFSPVMSQKDLYANTEVHVTVGSAQVGYMRIVVV